MLELGPIAGRILERLRSILVKVEDMWDKPINLFEKVKNPTETDETEDEKNELVILDDADN